MFARDWKARLVPGLAILLAAGLLGLAGCTWMSSDMASKARGQSALKRVEVQARLRTAVAINVASCPTHVNAAYLAIEYSLGAELDAAFYSEDSVTTCALGVMLIPCQPTATEQVLAGLYRAVVRTCGLKSVEA